MQKYRGHSLKNIDTPYLHLDQANKHKREQYIDFRRLIMLRYRHMLSEYIAKKLRMARHKLLENGSYFGEIPGVEGVWANAKNLEDCRKELREVLED